MSTSADVISSGHIENGLMYPHSNPGMEIVLVEEGHLEWAVQNVPEVLNPGTVFFTLPWQVHGSLDVREPRNKIFYTLFRLHEAYEQEVETIRMPAILGFSPEEEALISKTLVSAQQHAWPASDLFKTLFPELIRKQVQSSEVDRLASRSLLRAVIVELVTIISVSPQFTTESSPTFRRVRVFLEGLVETLDDPWTLEEMAAACGIKRTQFAKVTKQLTGYPPVQYLGRIRFERACDLLRNTERSITDIAFACGYSTSQYFSETFRKAVSMTPSEYRKSLPELETIMRMNWSHPEHRSVSDEQMRSKLFSKRKV